MTMKRLLLAFTFAGAMLCAYPQATPAAPHHSPTVYVESLIPQAQSDSGSSSSGRSGFRPNRGLVKLTIFVMFAIGGGIFKLFNRE